jgi:hypothetical protein
MWRMHTRLCSAWSKNDKGMGINLNNCQLLTQLSHKYEQEIIMIIIGEVVLIGILFGLKKPVWSVKKKALKWPQKSAD